MKSWNYNPVITRRDEEIMLFLWRIRITTFLTLREKFFSDVSDEVAYQRLCKLDRGGFILRFSLSGTGKRVIGLGKRGFEYLQERVLPELNAKVHKPQSPYHDLLCGAALYGEWLSCQPSGVKTYTEQDLRQTEVREIPSAIRKNADHYPDGLWLYSTGREKRAFALEVETTAKSFDRYVTISTFYVGQPFFENVIWIVPSYQHAQKILAASTEYSKLKKGLHLFINLVEFENKLWQSRFLNRDLTNWTLADLLNTRLDPNWVPLLERVLEKPPVRRKHAENSPSSSPLLNFRISFARLQRYKKGATAKKA